MMNTGVSNFISFTAKLLAKKCYFSFFDVFFGIFESMKFWTYSQWKPNPLIPYAIQSLLKLETEK